jgi:hypothetical protein
MFKVNTSKVGLQNSYSVLLSVNLSSPDKMHASFTHTTERKGTESVCSNEFRSVPCFQHDHYMHIFHLCFLEISSR